MSCASLTELCPEGTGLWRRLSGRGSARLAARRPGGAFSLSVSGPFLVLRSTTPQTASRGHARACSSSSSQSWPRSALKIPGGLHSRCCKSSMRHYLFLLSLLSVPQRRQIRADRSRSQTRARSDTYDKPDRPLPTRYPGGADLHILDPAGLPRRTARISAGGEARPATAPARSQARESNATDQEKTCLFSCLSLFGPLLYLNELTSHSPPPCDGTFPAFFLGSSWEFHQARPARRSGRPCPLSALSGP
ncbi:hypothetical protein GGR56DRAFT_66323 [Xylariaceae sp. FL0804]|nr:hypothetical protein GGR56DRAFT_66323 [Xylariaceae sp. FL0804]